MLKWSIIPVTNSNPVYSHSYYMALYFLLFYNFDSFSNHSGGKESDNWLAFHPTSAEGHGDILRYLVSEAIGEWKIGRAHV
jgi:hypothetical protein